jgi:hypothetical protein
VVDPVISKELDNICEKCKVTQEIKVRIREFFPHSWKN